MNSQRTYRGNCHEYRVPERKGHEPVIVPSMPAVCSGPGTLPTTSVSSLAACFPAAWPTQSPGSSPVLLFPLSPENFLLALGIVQMPLPCELSQCSLHTTTVSPCPCCPSKLMQRHSPLPSSSQGPSLSLVRAAGLRAEVKGAEERKTMYSAPLPQP